MQSTAPDVTTYLQEVPQDRRPSLTTLRNLCLATLSGYEEGMDHGMPCYKKDGVVEVAFASQKRHISLYILKHDVLDAHRDKLQGLSVGKSCINFTKPNKIDFAVVEQLLIGTRESPNPAC